MEKAVIFGAGYMGQGAYYKLEQFFDIIAFVDNNEKLWGQEFCGVKVISSFSLKKLQETTEIKIIICTKFYFEIARQLIQMHIGNLMVLLGGFLYWYGDENMMMPCEIEQPIPYQKESADEKNILFVQPEACIRTHKIAYVMKKAGYKVFLLYQIGPPKIMNEEFQDLYEKKYTTFSMNQFIDFVEKSEFDIIHSSNQPDYLTNLLLLTNKKVIHDTHDLSSAYIKLSGDELVQEYIANTKCSGLVHTSQGTVDITNEMYHNNNIPSLIIENMLVDRIEAKFKYKKLSELDGKLHCVYEGGISDNPNHFRFMEVIWKKIAKEGIHIHFYSQQRIEYCKELDKWNEYIHYEGNLSSVQLATEMTKYDCGLLLFNVNSNNKTHLETASANKLYEYLNAGIPVVSCGVDSFSNFILKNKVGCKLDFDKDIYQQINAVSKIKIEENFVEVNRLTLNANSEKIKTFYESIQRRI